MQIHAARESFWAAVHQVKRVAGVGVPEDSCLVGGVVARKNVAHRRMRTSMPSPRIIMLGSTLAPSTKLSSFHTVLDQVPLLPPAAAAAAAEPCLAVSPAALSWCDMCDAHCRLLSCTGCPSGVTGLLSRVSISQEWKLRRCGKTLLLQEPAQLRAAVEKLASFSPDVVLVENGVARAAQELLLEKGIAVVLNVKPALLERISRCTGGRVASSIDSLTEHCIASCAEFTVESLALTAVRPPPLPNFCCSLRDAIVHTDFFLQSCTH